MLKKLFAFFQYIIPHHALSRFIGFFANCRTKWVKNWLINWFINRYQVDMNLALETDFTKYATFNDFFTRKLDLSKRQVDTLPNSIISPADGKISQFGHIQKDQLIQAKGINYSLENLLGGKGTEQFQNGEFMTIYLSPRDYHRVHMPIDGELLSMHYIPGRLFSVNETTAETVSGLFTRNERLICYFKTEIGVLAVIMVGAMIVAGIHTSWHGKITPNNHSKIQSWEYKNKSFKQADEMGYFELGSTVILLFPKDSIKWSGELSTGMPIGFSQIFAEVQI